MAADSTQVQHRRTMLKARDLGLAQMNHEGHWELTRDGRSFLDMFDALRELDDREGAARSSSPLAAGSERAAPQRGGAPRGAGRGDERSTRRGAQEKRTP